MTPQSRLARNGGIPLTSHSARADEPERLTPRELEVVSWIGRGKRNQEIAKILKCSTATVKKHVQRALEKLRVETRTAACAWWHEKGKNLALSTTANPR
jgi:DNA-binding CsgD family transcriptional regulator